MASSNPETTITLRTYGTRYELGPLVSTHMQSLRDKSCSLIEVFHDIETPYLREQNFD